jgi:hypothetical protein
VLLVGGMLGGMLSGGMLGEMLGGMLSGGMLGGPSNQYQNVITKCCLYNIVFQ